MADDRTIRVRLLAEIQSYQEGMRRAGAATQEFGKNVSGMGDAVTADIERVGRSALLMSAGLAAGLGLSVKAAVDWESAWAGVTKTVDGTAEEMAALEDGLRRMATELPATHGEIAGVAEAAGQLGIAVGDVEEFTRVMVDLGETTNLSAEEAATSLARFSNIMGTSSDDVDRLGSTIVELGNNSETTEAEIVELATRLAAAGNIAGLSEADVLAFAASLTSVGVEAEAGGTALSKVFTSVRDAVLDGGEALETFASVSGMTGDEFRTAFGQNAAGTINEFIMGLGRMNAAGQSTTSVFEDLELTDQRLMRALLSTAAAGDHLTDRLGMSSQAWQDNTALAAEAANRYETTAAQMQVLRNQVTDVAIDAGQVLLPALNAVVGVLGEMVSGFAALPGPVTTAGVAVAGIATAALGVVGVLGVLGPKVIAAQRALEGMGRAGEFMGRNMGNAAKGVGALAGAMTAWSMWEGMMAGAAREASNFREEIDGILSSSTSYDQLNARLIETRQQIAYLRSERAGSQAPWDADFRATLDESIIALGELNSEYTDLANRAANLADRTGITRNEAHLLLQEQERLGLSANSTGSALTALGANMPDAQASVLASALGVTTDQLHQMTGAAFGAADGTDALADAMARMASAPLERRAAELDLEDALAAVNDAQKALNGTGRQGVATTNDAAAAARRLEDANRRVADSQRTVADAEELVAEKREKLRLIMEGYGEGSEEAATAEERAEKAKRDAERAEIALKDAQKNLNDPRMLPRERRRVQLDLADAQDRVRDTARAAEKAQQELSDALRGADPASKKAVDAADDLDDAERSLEDALRGQADALRAVDEAAATRARNMPAGATRDQAGLERDLRRAMLDLEQTYIDNAIAEGDRRIELLEASGETVTATERNEIYREELGKVADTLSPDSPLRQRLLDYIDDLATIPGSVSTSVSLDTVSAEKQLYDFGKRVSKAMADIANPDVMTPIPLPSSSSGLAQILNRSRRAGGGPVLAGGSYVVGENGPELLQMGNATGYVNPTSQLMSAPASPYSSSVDSSSHVTNSVTVIARPHEDAGQAAVRALREEAFKKWGGW